VTTVFQQAADQARTIDADPKGRAVRADCLIEGLFDALKEGNDVVPDLALGGVIIPFRRRRSVSRLT
jgi:hypothetical protein